MKKVFLALCYLFYLFFSYADATISILESSTKNKKEEEVYKEIPKFWYKVLHGKAISEPIITETGFTVVCDDRQMYSFQDNGTLDWKNIIPGSRNPIVSISPKSFSIVVTASRKFSVYNSNGTELWQGKAPHPIEYEPLQGLDGRIFVRDKTNVSCFGLNGIKKWTIKLPSSCTNQVATLNDGSLLFISEKPGNTKAYRVSPYGKIFEEITLIGKVVTISPISQGIIFTFEDGTFALCSVVNNEFKTVWIIVPDKEGGRQLVIYNDYLVISLSSDGNLSLFDMNNRQTRWTKKIPAIPLESIKYFNYVNNNQIVILSKKKGLAYNISGEKDWEIKIDTDARYITYTPRGNILTCSDSWMITMHHIKDVKKRYVEPVRSARNYCDYLNNISRMRMQKDLTDKDIENMKEILKNGDYGEKEKIYSDQLLYGLRGMLISYTEIPSDKRSSYVEFDLPFKKKIIELLPYFGSTEYQDIFETILRNETDSSILIPVIEACGQIAYDQNYGIINSIQLLVDKLSSKNASNLGTFLAICDAVSNMSFFMGTAPIVSKSKAILTRLMYFQYGSTVNKYAAEKFSEVLKIKVE